MTSRLSDDALRRIASAGKEAGWWQDVQRIVRPRMDAQPWWDELAAKLEAIGMSLQDFDSNQLLTWHEDGYTTDETLEVILQTA